MRVLMFAEPVTLAHVARPIALGRGLLERGVDVCIATGPERRAWVESAGLRFAPLASISSQQFVDALARGRPLYDTATLQAYVAADRMLIAAERPHAVVGDFRLSLSVSARLAGVPYLTVTNAYWSPFVRLPFPLPVLPLSRMLPLPLARLLFAIGSPVAMRIHTRPLNEVRRHHGLAPLPADLRTVYTDADVVLYADDDAMFPMAPLPAHHRFLGPVLWSPPVELPGWWGDLTDTQPVVYVTLGSSGSSAALDAVLAALAREPVQVIASSAGATDVMARHARQRIAPYLPGDQATARAALVVCNGGSMTTQQALSFGRPVLGIPGNMDQFMNMGPLLASGAARCVRADRLRPAAITAAVQGLLGSADAAAASRRLGQRFPPAGAAVERLADALASAVR